MVSVQARGMIPIQYGSLQSVCDMYRNQMQGVMGGWEGTPFSSTNNWVLGYEVKEGFLHTFKGIF